jgi:hypothetical protein
MTNFCALDQMNVFVSLEFNLSREGARQGNGKERKENASSSRLFLSWSHVCTDIMQVDSSWLSLGPDCSTADDDQGVSAIDIRHPSATASVAG